MQSQNNVSIDVQMTSEDQAKVYKSLAEEVKKQDLPYQSIVVEFNGDISDMAKEILKLRKLTDEMAKLIENRSFKKKRKKHGSKARKT